MSNKVWRKAKSATAFHSFPGVVKHPDRQRPQETGNSFLLAVEFKRNPFPAGYRWNPPGVWGYSFVYRLTFDLGPRPVVPGEGGALQSIAHELSVCQLALAGCFRARGSRLPVFPKVEHCVPFLVARQKGWLIP